MPANDGSVRREVFALAAAGVLLLAMLAAASYWFARDVAREESVRDAVIAATQVEELAVRPHIRPGLADGDPQAFSALDEVVRERVLQDPVVAVRLWDADGTIVYSNTPELVGSRFALDEEAAEILQRGGVKAELSDLSKPENRFERDHGELIEVYLPTSGVDGRAHLLEIYQRQDYLEAATQRMVAALAPTIVGAMVVLVAILLLLAVRMARRLDRDRERREELLVYAVNASEAERRRIAADLHDGVVQDLAGVAFSLSALGARTPDPAQAEQLDAAADHTRRAVGSLRTLLVDIYPPNLREAGLAAALHDLAERLDCPVAVDVPAGLDLPPRCEQAIYRIAREAVHNIRKHARARRAWINVRRAGGRVELEVGDDGVGMRDGAPGAGHVGMTLMQDLAAQVNGRLVVESAPERGTVIRFSMGCRP